MLSRVRRLILLAVLPAALVAACGGGSNSGGGSKTNDPTSTTHTSAPSAQSGHYHAGEHCRQSLSFAYSAQGFSCVNGTLHRKPKHTAPATVHHHSHTNTGAPQGY
ncbi:MAG: hypothetical protein ACTHQQ_18910 [Solirubrobacteraceae bacterium]